MEVTVISILAILACAPPTNSPIERDSLQQRRNLVDDATYTLPLPDGFDPAERVEGEIFTWEYDRQVVYRERYDPVAPQFGVEVAPEHPSDAFPGVVKIDAEGRLWRAVAYDQAALDASILASSLDSPENTEVLADAAPAPLDGVPGGTVSTVEYQSWWNYSCFDSFTQMWDGVRLWDEESRAPIVAPTDRQKALIKVSVNGEACAGTILRSNWVLTAAHCVTDPASHDTLPGVQVDRLDAAGTHTPILFAIDEDWIDGSGAARDDWALIKVGTPFVEPFESMQISGATDETIELLTSAHNLSLPKWINSGSPPYCVQTSSRYHNSSDRIGAVYDEVLNIDMDGTQGHSGGPVYYCPAGDVNVCASGEQGFILAVWSSWNSLQWTHRGAKGPHFQDAANAIMNDF